MASINYDDTRFTELEKDKQTAIDNSNATYDELINTSNQHYDNLINQSKEWADKQAEIQNQQTQFTVDKIEQQKQEAEKDYTKEQKGAYQDYMKNINPYGSASRSMVEQGLSNSGASRTEQIGYYNLYQQRYLQARESYNEIIMNYNNNIKEAELQNNSALAQIYADANKEQLELALQQYSVIADLKLNKLNTSMTLDSEYNDRWRQIEAQINTENALAEEIRQYNENLKEEKRQFDLSLEEEQRQYNESYELQKQQVSASDPHYSQSDAEIYGTFSNKYQPKGISGYGELSKSNLKVSDVFGGVSSAFGKQNIWVAKGNYFVWDGEAKDYVNVTKQVEKSLKNKTTLQWGF